MCVAAYSNEKKAEDWNKEGKETKNAADFFLVQENLGNYVTTVGQGLDRVGMQRLVAKKVLNPTGAQTLNISLHPFLKKDACVFCRDTAYGHPLSSLRIPVVLLITAFWCLCFLTSFVPIPFPSSKKVQLHQDVWSRLCSLHVSQIP